MVNSEARILEILKDKEMYGYEIVKVLNESLDHSFEHRIGTLYPILRSLEKRRFLKAYEINKDGKNRIYYKRTKKMGGVDNES